MLKMCTCFACFLDEKCEVLSGETLFHWIGADKLVRLSSETVFLRIGPLFHQMGPRVSPDRTSSKNSAPILKRHSVCKSVQRDDLYANATGGEMLQCTRQTDGGDRRGFTPGCGALQTKQRRSTMTDSEHRGHGRYMGGRLRQKITDPDKVMSLVGCRRCAGMCASRSLW